MKDQSPGSQAYYSGSGDQCEDRHRGHVSFLSGSQGRPAGFLRRPRFQSHGGLDFPSHSSRAWKTFFRRVPSGLTASTRHKSRAPAGRAASASAGTS